MTVTTSAQHERTIPYAEWQAQYRRMADAAERSRNSRRVLLDRACREAGLGAYHGCVLHNAIVGLNAGRPWREVNYSAARRAQRIERSLFDASRIVDRWAARVRPSFGDERFRTGILFGVNRAGMAR